MPPTGGQREGKSARQQQVGGAGGIGGTAGPSRGRGAFVYRGEFRQNIEDMMYAFGDVEKPEADSVSLMEDMTVTFLVDLCHRARPAPHKIPIPSNQNTINSIASALFRQEEEAGKADAAAAAVAATSSSAAARRVAAAKERGAAAGTATVSSQSIIPPRLAAHPYVARPRMTVEDLKFACRKDEKLSCRIEELLYLDKVITAAQKAFDNPEEDVAERTAAT